MAWLALWPLCASGEDLPIVSVRCAELVDEACASVEARARADLAVKGITSGLLSASCGEGMAVASFAPSYGPPLVETEPLATTEKDRIEQLLALLDRITTRVAEANSAPVEPPQPPPPNAESDARPPAPLENAELTKTEVPTASAQTPLDPTSLRDARRPLAENAVLLVTAGSGAHYWTPATLGAIGPRAGMGVEFEETFAIRVVGGMAWTLKQPSGLRGRLTFGSLEARLGLVEPLNLVLGGGVSVLRFVAPEGWSPTRRTSVTPFGVARLELAQRFGALSIQVGPELAISGLKRSIELNDGESFEVPRVQAGLVVGSSMALFSNH